MANAFDQFDQGSSGGGNAFDQFDAAGASSAQGPSTASDMLKSGATGLAKGVIGLAGLPEDAAELLGRGVAAGERYMGMDTSALDASNAIPSHIGSAGIQKGVESVTGPLYQPQTTAGKYAQSVGEFVPAVVGGPESLAARVATRAVVPGIASEAAGEAADAAGGSAWAPYARAAAAIAGGVGAPALARRAITPFPISAERQAAVQTLRNEGVTDLTAGQITGKVPLRYFESEMGGNAAAQLMENQADQFTSAALRRVGENANRATPDVIDHAFDRIGGEFDRLSANNTMNVDTRLWGELQNANREYQVLTPPAMRSPLIENVVDNIGEAAVNNQGTLDGETYQALRSRLDRAARGAKADPQLSGALFDIRGSLDDAMERSMVANGRPDDVAAWQAARRQYRNMMVIEKAATGAGENAAQGIISPSQLRAATVAQNRRGYARGQGDFADLARAGEAVMKPLPNSGTAGRLAAHHLGTLGASVPAVLGGGAGAVAGGPLGAGVGAALGALAPRVAGRLAVSGPGRAFLANQIAAGRAVPSVGALPAVTAGNAGVGNLPALPALSQLQGTSPAGAQDNQRQRGGRRNDEPNRNQQPKGGFAQGGKVNAGKVQARFHPQSMGARKAKDGQWYIRDKARPGKYLRVVGRG